ncbi:MAG: hypothetical protein BGO49_25310 [Planctomycetales bacterium 71-10]|nr:MAG: hypothetical protein BGO49_25310 [Planctomycetales bacterium 71-10]
MGERAKPARIPTVLAVAATAVVCYLLGAAGPKTVLGQAGKPANEPTGPVGTYQVSWLPHADDPKAVSPFLLDTRTGVIYQGARISKDVSGYFWQTYVDHPTTKPSADPSGR